MKPTLLLAAFLVALTLAPPTRACAIADEAALTDEARAEAQALFRRAVELGAEDRWSEALELFRRSRDIVARPNTVFNVGFALYRLGHFTEAIEAFDQYTAIAGPDDTERREEAVRLRGESAAALSELELELEPADAQVAIDGVRVELDARRRVSLDPGRHMLRVTRDGYEDVELELAVLAGERGARSVRLVARGALAAERAVGEEGSARDPVDGAAPSPSITEEPLFWVVMVIGVLAVGGAVAAIAVTATQPEGSPSGGTTGVVLEGLRF